MTAEYERIRDWWIVKSRNIGREWSLDRWFGLSPVVCFEDTEYRLKQSLQSCFHRLEV
jgi:hypothetical protein